VVLDGDIVTGYGKGLRGKWKYKCGGFIREPARRGGMQAIIKSGSKNKIYVVSFCLREKKRENSSPKTLIGADFQCFRDGEDNAKRRS
jgi:hypothetical protein